MSNARRRGKKLLTYVRGFDAWLENVRRSIPLLAEGALRPTRRRFTVYGARSLALPALWTRLRRIRRVHGRGRDRSVRGV